MGHLGLQVLILMFVTGILSAENTPCPSPVNFAGIRTFLSALCWEPALILTEFLPSEAIVILSLKATQDDRIKSTRTNKEIAYCG